MPVSLLKQSLLTGTPDEVIERIAAWRDQGVRYSVLANLSIAQTKLGRGLAAALPFAQILRGIRKL